MIHINFNILHIFCKSFLEDNEVLRLIITYMYIKLYLIFFFYSFITII